ncbi:MAG: TetR family transcriptional regulator [Alphaproteobacteria bacterium PRO2]|nr:TetR family transcriptional regulator [Alphaproteobacteria bacterium PRO2]
MRRAKEDAKKTREDILNAAVRFFSEKGVARTTLDEVAKAANVTRGAVYWHFENKTQIFEALHDRLHRPFIDMILDDLKKDHPEPVIQLRDLCTKILLDLEQDEQKRQALFLFLIKCDYSGDLAIYKDEHREKKAESMRLFKHYFEKAKRAGKLPPKANPELLAESTSCFMKGILFEYLDNQKEFNIKDKVPKLIGLFFKNIGLEETDHA